MSLIIGLFLFIVYNISHHFKTFCLLKGGAQRQFCLKEVVREAQCWWNLWPDGRKALNFTLTGVENGNLHACIRVVDKLPP